VKKVFLIILTSVLLYTTAIVNAADLPKQKITLEQAKMLVLAALTPAQRRLPGLAFEGDVDKAHKTLSSDIDSKNTRFAVFYVIWNGMPDSSITVGFYAVDIYTGDVFSSVMDCAEYYNKKLEILQRKIRHSLHLTNTQYKKIKTKGPTCMN